MCPHTSTDLLDKESVLEKMRVLGRWNARRAHQVSRPHKRRKVPRPFLGAYIASSYDCLKLSLPACGACQSTMRPFLCLQCPFIGCWQDGHMKDHLEDAGHNFCMFKRLSLLFPLVGLHA